MTVSQAELDELLALNALPVKRNDQKRRESELVQKVVAAYRGREHAIEEGKNLSEVLTE